MSVVLTKDGRQKRIERILTIRCDCGQSLSSAGEEPWIWIKSPGAEAFKARHQEHTLAHYFSFNEADE